MVGLVAPKAINFVKKEAQEMSDHLDGIVEKEMEQEMMEEKITD